MALATLSAYQRRAWRWQSENKPASAASAAAAAMVALNGGSIEKRGMA